MLSLTNLKPTSGSKKSSKRLGRGNASGKGTTCGRGANGQNSRSGGNVPAWFEGGQTPLFRRMPKLKGFSNAIFKKEYNLVNLTDLAKLAEKGITEINREVLLENGVIRNKTAPIKVLGKGEISAKISVVAEKASASAIDAVSKAGGKIELK
ncbi:50S ribosomal protein L15 [Candidatus Gracilibacteria bacterium]|nr:50S ribosomal protein L15 [Candidatus Gracilibacteria bacterium]